MLSSCHAQIKIETAKSRRNDRRRIEVRRLQSNDAETTRRQLAQVSSAEEACEVKSASADLHRVISTMFREVHSPELLSLKLVTPRMTC